MREGGKKFDQEKPRLELLDRYAIEQIALVLEFGANKYGVDNWRGGIKNRRLIGAALRHIYAIADGEDIDPESGLSHAAHAACCIMFLTWTQKFRPDLDDRFKLEEKRKEIVADKFNNSIEETKNVDNRFLKTDTVDTYKKR